MRVPRNLSLIDATFRDRARKAGSGNLNVSTLLYIVLLTLPDKILCLPLSSTEAKLLRDYRSTS